MDENPPYKGWLGKECQDITLQGKLCKCYCQDWGKLRMASNLRSGGLKIVLLPRCAYSLQRRRTHRGQYIYYSNALQNPRPDPPLITPLLLPAVHIKRQPSLHLVLQFTGCSCLLHRPLRLHHIMSTARHSLFVFPTASGNLPFQYCPITTRILPQIALCLRTCSRHQGGAALQLVRR